MNVIASSNDEYDFGADLVKAFEGLDVQATYFNLQVFRALDLFLDPTADPDHAAIFPEYVLSASVLCFTSMEFVDREMQEIIDELMEKRTLRGTLLPNLRSVIVSYDFADQPDEIIRLQRLHRAVTVAFS